MTREETLKKILDKSDKNKIDLLTLYPILDKAFEDMQDIIYSKVDEIEKQKIWGMRKRDNAHIFNKMVIERDKIIKSNVEQIKSLQVLLQK